MSATLINSEFIRSTYIILGSINCGKQLLVYFYDVKKFVDLFCKKK